MKKLLLFLVLFAALYNSVFAQTIPAYVSTDSLLGWWPFSGNADNALGTGLNGRITGATLTTDRFGNANSAYKFNGSTDRITVDSYFFNVGWHNFTVSSWFFADSLNNSNNTNNNGSTFNTIPHNGICIVYNWMTDYKYLICANQVPGVHTWNILGYEAHSTIVPQVWKHIVLVKRNDTAYSFYINGVLDTTFHTTLLASTYYCKVVFGNTDSSVSFFGFLGKTDDYGIWNRALNHCEIIKLYNSAAYAFITAQPTNVTTTVGATVHFSIADTGSGNIYQWQVDNGSGFTDLTNVSPYSGATTDTLTLTGVSYALNTHHYRCVVTGTGGCTDTSIGASLLIPEAVPQISGSNKICIYPNPAWDNIYLQNAEKLNIRVYNSMGQLVKEAFDAENVPIGNLPAAVYHIVLFDANGKMVYSSPLVRQ